MPLRPQMAILRPFPVHDVADRNPKSACGLRAVKLYGDRCEAGGVGKDFWEAWGPQRPRPIFHTRRCENVRCCDYSSLLRPCTCTRVIECHFCSILLPGVSKHLFGPVNAMTEDGNHYRRCSCIRG